MPWGFILPRFIYINNKSKLGYLTTKPEVSVALFVHELLRSLQTNLYQTWQGGPDWARKTPRGTRFHGNLMATRKTVFFMARSALGWDIRLPVMS